MSTVENSGTPKSGIYRQHFKASVRPQDDLYRHVNGGWIDSAEIPADRSSDGAFYQLYEAAEKNVRTIIENQPTGPGNTVAEKIGNLYASFMAEEKINALGVSPIQSEIDQALAISSKAEFHQALGEFEAKGHGGLFYEYVTSDKMDSNINIAYIGQSGLSLPDEAYYREEEFAPIRQALLLHIEKLLTLAGVSDGASHAARVMALETTIASHHWDEVRDRDVNATYNKMSLGELKKLSEGFDWDAWLAASKTPANVLATCIVRQPSFFAGIGAMMNEFDVTSWSSWLTWHLISGSTSYLSTELAQANFDFYGTTLSGTPEMRARWKRAVSLVEGSLGEAVGLIYVAQHFPEEAKTRMVELVNNLLEAYRISISSLSWMSEATKARALEKVAKFRPKIGYPDKWRDYSGLEISADDLVGNLARIAQFNQDYEFAKVGQEVDRDEWLMTPQTVNAYYLPTGNEVVFPAAILQPPFFDLEADDAANYGGIGAVIGHEIGHGFDDQGSKYDGDGNLNNWWSDGDRAEF